MGGIDLQRLRQERAAIAAATRAPLTIGGYASDWKIWAAWCERAGRPALPASSDTVQLYLMHMAQRGRLPATMARHVAAIAAWHAAAGARSPVDADVREVLAGLRRRIGAAPKHAKAAVTVEQLRLMLRSCSDDAEGARNRALLLVGFASGLRRSELVALLLADVVFDPRGLVLSLGRSKTDQEGHGRVVGVHPGEHLVTCPVRALQAWLVERGGWPGALFASIKCGAIRRKPMAVKSVCDAVQVAAAAAGLDATMYGAHSLRAGLVTAAGPAGVGTLAIMARTGHRTSAVVERYMRPANALAVNPLAGLL